MKKTGMKKLLFIGCILILSLILFACKKESANEKNPPKLDTDSEKSVVEFYNTHSARLLKLLGQSNENMSGIFTGATAH